MKAKDLHTSESSHPSAQREPRGRDRRGYTLVLVLGLTTVMSALGLTYLDTTSTVMPEAINHMGSTRAQYLAGSGVSLGTHFLMYPQTTVPYGQYWTGGSNIAIDGTTDYVDVAVLRSDGWSPPLNDPNRYRITATGVAKGFDGSIRAKRTVISDVQIPKTGQWEIMQGLVLTSATTMYSQVKVTGDLHCNSNLTAYGWCQGKVTATGLLLWLGSGPPSSTASSADAVSVPSSTATYSTYTIQGKSYTAYTAFSASELKASDAAALNAIDMSATNPGRIIIAKSGNFKMRSGVNLNGTLVVSGGRLEMDDAGAQTVTAVPGFPALVVVSNDMKILNDDCVFNVVGSIICTGGYLDVNSKRGLTMTVTGAAIFRDAPSSFGSSCTCNFNWNANRATFWDVQNVVPPKPVTVLSWKEQ